EYRIEVEDIATLALVTSRIPDVIDPTRKARMPPSIHKPLAILLLLACSRANDPLTILLILSLLLRSKALPSPVARQQASEVTSLFKPVDLKYCREQLEDLASKGDSDAMTLLGQYLEYEGRPDQAKPLYEKALENANTKVVLADPRVLFLNTTPAWNALGCLLLAKKDQKSREQARAAFEIGALKADDPLSYYHLASFEENQTGKWLKYMSKAAASGHREAMFQLGRFYQNLAFAEQKRANPSIVADKRLARALKWLGWKEDGPRELALDWYKAATMNGYKPAALELVKMSDAKGDAEAAKTYLIQLCQPPPPGEIEQWPSLVQEARKR
ncbi:hypothetical protein K504DRAFT_334060, partial [Pleomassaria siparia CBS 279.74]